MVIGLFFTPYPNSLLFFQLDITGIRRLTILHSNAILRRIFIRRLGLDDDLIRAWLCVRDLVSPVNNERL